MAEIKLDLDSKNLPSNSNSAKKLASLEPVAKAKVKKSSIFSETLSEVLCYIRDDILIPRAKEVFSEAVNNGLNMALFGEARPRNNNSNSNKTFVNYGGFSRNDPPFKANRIAKPPRKNNFDDYIMSKTEANDALNQLVDYLDTYDEVTVANFYETIGVEPKHVDNTFGWTDLSMASVKRAYGGGYFISLPRPVELDQ